ncbi:DUF484 family protein [Nereida ignava]|uniref:Recombinase XerC n=1 Tax=Nereida ignava TaxID=282199 RepID=A0A0U1NIE8_9RHOB|nr:DUF484 family protein [Nereida ignava]CRK74468.1 hypothetical protein NIG5292_00498 [Nereida ignava]SFJ20701.1 hypothetical protein SAMN02745667_00659 [Nereida ignava DSM 16309]
MTDTNKLTDAQEALRKTIIETPELVLEDHDVMMALVAANDRGQGTNVVDLRGAAMERLEARLDRLEDTHRSVIAAAYENLAGTNQVQRAILRMLDSTEFETFLQNLGGEVAEILRVDCVRLVLESSQSDSTVAAQTLADVLNVHEAGFIEDYVTAGKGGESRTVTLRQVSPKSAAVYGDKHEWIRSEACIKLDLGKGRLGGMLVMGAEDPHMFKPQQGTDLLAFFGGVFERALRRWLA